MQQVKEIDVLSSSGYTGGGRAHTLAISWQPHYNGVVCESTTCQAKSTT